MHFALLDWLARHEQSDWSLAVVDRRSVRAVSGGDQTGPNPTDRAKRGSERHLICDGRGVPLAGWREPRRHPDCVLGDRGYDAASIRRGLRARLIAPLLATRRTTHGVAWAGGAGSWSARSRG